MKKYFLLLSFLFIGFASCKKSSFNATAQAAADDATIKAYISTYGIPNAVKDPSSGLWYSITTPGTGAHPTASSNVSVSYTLNLSDGTLLENHSSSYFQLPITIRGWQIGIPFIGVGGSIILLVPSALGYGNAVQGSIPANSVLIYNIGLQGFN
jgi:FKBP-type peptidyl-prolyl cis-trans isomerase FkpA